MFWQYRYTVSPDARVCCGANNRGLAILGDTLFMGTLDGHLVAIDATSGRPLWNVPVGDPKLGYSITMAPLIVKDKVLVGVGGGEYGIRGFIAAFDAQTGKEAVALLHRFPGPASRATRRGRGDAWKTGGGIRVGDAARTIRRSTSRTGASAIPGRTGTRSAARRQPLYRLRRRARRRYRRS